METQTLNDSETFTNILFSQKIFKEFVVKLSHNINKLKNF